MKIEFAGWEFICQYFRNKFNHQRGPKKRTVQWKYVSGVWKFLEFWLFSDNWNALHMVSMHWLTPSNVYFNDFNNDKCIWLKYDLQGSRNCPAWNLYSWNLFISLKCILHTTTDFIKVSFTFISFSRTCSL